MYTFYIILSNNYGAIYGCGYDELYKFICWFDVYFNVEIFRDDEKPESFSFFYGDKYKFVREIFPWNMLLLRRFYKIETSWQNMYCTYFYNNILRLLNICYKF